VSMVHLAYTIRSSNSDNLSPTIVIDVGRNETIIKPATPTMNTYWIAFLDASNPRVKVKEWIIPGKEHSVVPAGIDTYMNDPRYIYVVATQTLWVYNIPQGPFYDFLAKYGAGRALQRLEQINAQGQVLTSGGYDHVSYCLTSQCGPRGGPLPAPASYEVSGTYESNLPAILLLSLMASSSGGPPYSIMDAYTWTSPPTQA
jgi:hypothetical protein